MILVLLTTLLKYEVGGLKYEILSFTNCPLPTAQCPMPNANCKLQSNYRHPERSRRMTLIDNCLLIIVS